MRYSPKDNLLALLRISKFLVVTDQVLLIPGILLHGLVVLEALEDDLAEAIIVCDIAHLRVEELRHQGSCRSLIMNLRPCQQSYITTSGDGVRLEEGD